MHLLKKLNSTGALHIIAPLIFIVGAGLVGTYLLVASHADHLPTGNAYNYQLLGSAKGTTTYACKMNGVAYVKVSVSKVVRPYTHMGYEITDNGTAYYKHIVSAEAGTYYWSHSYQAKQGMTVTAGVSSVNYDFNTVSSRSGFISQIRHC